MANELTLSASLAYAKASYASSFSFGPLTFSVTGTNYVRFAQTVGITAGVLELGDVATPGFCLLVNRDPTNYVEIREGATGDDVVKLLPGEPALFRFAAAAPYAIANTAPCQVEGIIISA